MWRQAAPRHILQQLSKNDPLPPVSVSQSPFYCWPTRKERHRRSGLPFQSSDPFLFLQPCILVVVLGWQQVAQVTPGPFQCRKTQSKILWQGKGIFLSTHYRSGGSFGERGARIVGASKAPATHKAPCLQFPEEGRWPGGSTATRLHPVPWSTGHETVTTAHVFFNPWCFTRMKSKIQHGEIMPKMFSLTWRKQQLATDLLLACPPSKQPKGLLHVFPTQGCLQSFVLPSGTFLSMISSDVWRYFGISTLSLEVFQSTSPKGLLWRAVSALSTAFLILYRSPRFLPTQLEAGNEAQMVCSNRHIVIQFVSARVSS